MFSNSLWGWGLLGCAHCLDVKGADNGEVVLDGSTAVQE